MTTAPDYIEAVSAWRMWRVVRARGETGLASLFQGVAWPWRDALEADCRALRTIWRRKCHRHAAPRADCVCGVYGVPLRELDPRLLSPFRRDRPVVILGRVSLWGTVVESEHGWRASLGYPECLFVPMLVRRDAARAQTLAAELAPYGVPVEVVSVAGMSGPRAAVIDRLSARAA